MRTDHTTYQLARRVSIFGLLLQGIASLVTLTLGYAAKDHVTQACGWYMFFGLPVWGTLVILFHQHWLERLEALEAEQIHAQHGQTTSIFDAAGSDLNIAARRLRWMHQFFLPLMSLITAVGLLGVGFWQLSVMSTRLAEADFVAQTLLVADANAAPWGLVITAAMAAISFIFSRYVSGMSNQRAWRHLRAGASVSVGIAVFAGILAVAYGFTVTGNTSVMPVLARIIPYLILLAGGEIVVNFVLNLYRPRKAGEFPRPAFDSRILSLAAAPDSLARSISDAVNYQFGFDVTSTWGYRLISRQAWILIAFFTVILVGLNCVSIVRLHEQAIVTSFGLPARGGEPFDSGIVWKWPWEKVEAYSVHRVHQLRIGKEYEEDDGPILWGKQHTKEVEDLVIVGPMQGSGSLGDSVEGSNDNVIARNYSVLNFEVPIQYRIKRGIDKNGVSALWNYIQLTKGGEKGHEAYVRALATRVITQRAANLRIDDVLGIGRSKLAYDLRQRLQNELDQRNAGIEVLFVGISGIHPPVDVAPLFQEVRKAEEERESRIQMALAEAIKALADVAGTEEKAQAITIEIERLEATARDDPQYDERQAAVERLLLNAGGAAAITLLQAQAERWIIHLDAWTRFIEQDSQFAGFEAAPRLYKFRELVLRTAEALGKTRLFIVAPGYENQVTIDLHEDRTFISTGGG